jgi:hypothetical protein
VLAWSKEPKQTLSWPSDEKPILRFTVDNVSKVGAFGKEGSYILDVTVQNLWSKAIERAEFSTFFYDKNGVRIGDGWLDIDNLGPAQAAKIAVHAALLGTPVRISVAPRELPPELRPAVPPKQVSISIFSVPSGALLKVDGKEVGTTPFAANLTVGSHLLSFQKEGYATGNYPLVISPGELAGGTVTYELGGSSHDTIELRDGSVITGDVESMDAASVVVEVGGKPQNFDRNQVKRILLVQRSTAGQQ